MTRIFVAGAAGVIGRRLVPQLLTAGYQVIGTTRSAPKAVQLEAQGAQAMIVDVLDPAAIARELAAARADAGIHQLTDLAAHPDPAQAADYAARNARLRRLGTQHLVAGVRQAKVGRLIAQSIAWVYAPGDAPRTEADPLDLEAQGSRAVSVGGVAALESAVLGDDAFTGVVLRYGRALWTRHRRRAATRRPAGRSRRCGRPRRPAGARRTGSGHL